MAKKILIIEKEEKKTFSVAKIWYSALNYAMDLTSLMDERTDIAKYITEYIERFKNSVAETMRKFL